jgi:hypothetical protein
MTNDRNSLISDLRQSASMSGLVFDNSLIAAVLAITRRARARAQSRSDGARARNRNEPR